MTEEKTQYKSLKKKKLCEVCKKEVSTRNWARHLVSKTHTAKADGTYKEPAYKQKKEKKQRKKKPVEEKKEEGVLQETKGEDPCLEICRKARLPPVYHTVKTGIQSTTEISREPLARGKRVFAPWLFVIDNGVKREESKQERDKRLHAIRMAKYRLKKN
jgi:hypothetical protein